MSAKDIVIKPIDSKSSVKIVSRLHYSGKCTQNSQIHLGVFLNNKLEGALQFGPSIDKRRMASNLGIGFNHFLELNRMALSDTCPKNSESRALGVSLRLLKKTYPHLRVIVSFADACQCGDGTIYKASGFKLHSFKKNTSLLVGPNGDVVAKKSLDDKICPTTGKYMSSIYVKERGYKPLVGYQMKYLYFFDKELEKQHDFIDFKDIPKEIRMYKGIKRIEHESNATDYQSVESGAIPTDALHLREVRNG